VLLAKELTQQAADRVHVNIEVHHQLQGGLLDLARNGIVHFESCCEVHVSTPAGECRCPPGRAWKLLLDVTGEPSDLAMRALMLSIGDRETAPGAAPAANPELQHGSGVQLSAVCSGEGAPQLHLAFTTAAPAKPPGWAPGQTYSWPDMAPYFQATAVNQPLDLTAARAAQSAARGSSGQQQLGEEGEGGVQAAVVEGLQGLGLLHAFQQTTAVLAECKNSGLFHRDMKPKDILLDLDRVDLHKRMQGGGCRELLASLPAEQDADDGYRCGEPAHQAESGEGGGEPATNDQTNDTKHDSPG